MEAKFYRIKKEIRILGIDDSPFARTDKQCALVGTIFRGGSWLDGILSTKVRVDGMDATDRVSKMIENCKFKDIRVVMLDGLGFAGFNLVDIEELNARTGLPVVVIVRKMPNFVEIESALNNLNQKKKRLSYIEKAGEPKRVQTKPKKFIYIQTKGIRFKDAEQIVKLSATRSLIPEPIRVAHLIASGMALGESRGGA